MIRFSSAVSLAAALAAVPALAAESTMQAGQWEYTMKMEMPGMPVAMPATTYKHCLTQAEIDKGEQYKTGDKAGGQQECEIKNMQHSGKGASYDIVCKDGTTGHYDFTTSGSSMQGKGVMKVQGQEMTTSFSAKRLGDC